MLLYSEFITPRLKFITELFGKELFGNPFELSSDKEYYLRYKGAKINYSNAEVNKEAVWIVPHGLLSEQSISEQQILCFDHEAS